MDSIQERQAKRFLILKTIYDLAGGQMMTPFVVDSIGEQLGLERREAFAEMVFLREKGLIRLRNMYGDITRQGIEEVERKLAAPEQPTAHFPAGNLIYVQNMIGSQIQQASHGSSQTQTVTLDLGAVRELVDKYADALPDLPLSDDSKAEASAEIATIRAQIESIRPKDVVIRECLKTLRNLLEGIVANVIAAKLLLKFSALLGLAS